MTLNGVMAAIVHYYTECVTFVPHYIHTGDISHKPDVRPSVCLSVCQRCELW